MRKQTLTPELLKTIRHNIEHTTIKSLCQGLADTEEVLNRQNGMLCTLLETMERLVWVTVPEKPGVSGVPYEAVLVDARARDQMEWQANRLSDHQFISKEQVIKEKDSWVKSFVGVQEQLSTANERIKVLEAEAKIAADKIKSLETNLVISENAYEERAAADMDAHRKAKYAAQACQDAMVFQIRALTKDIGLVLEDIGKRGISLPGVLSVLEPLQKELTKLAARYDTSECKAPEDPEHPHIVDGEFQSDKYPWCLPGFVPLKLTDPMAQDLLWEYANRRRVVDREFASDLYVCLVDKGFKGYEPSKAKE